MTALASFVSMLRTSYLEKAASQKTSVCEIGREKKSKTTRYVGKASSHCCQTQIVVWTPLGHINVVICDNRRNNRKESIADKTWVLFLFHLLLNFLSNVYFYRQINVPQRDGCSLCERCMWMFCNGNKNISIQRAASVMKIQLLSKRLLDTYVKAILIWC